MDAGYRVHLAHPGAIKKYEGLKHSGDFADAAYLAQLLRLGLLAAGYIYPREERGARDLARKRMQLVRYRTAQILSIEGILMRQTGARMKGEVVKRLTAEQVDEFAFAPDVALALEANRAVVLIHQRLDGGRIACQDRVDGGIRQALGDRNAFRGELLRHVSPQAFDGDEPRQGSQGHQHPRPEQDDLGPEPEPQLRPAQGLDGVVETLRAGVIQCRLDHAWLMRPCIRTSGAHRGLPVGDGHPPVVFDVSEVDAVQALVPVHPKAQRSADA
jgi:hypothetical protein